MTRKDYISVAGVLQNTFSFYVQSEKAGNGDRKEQRGIVLSIAEALADQFHDDNPRFDRNHFLAVVRDEKDLNSRPSRNGSQSCSEGC